jgi:hypothetical protein
MRWTSLVCTLLLASALTVACGHEPATPPAGPTPTPAPNPNPTPQPLTTATFVGAGDIADCLNDNGRHAEDTAKLLDKIPGAIFTAGDNQYPYATLANFNSCFGPRWGRHKSRIHPAAGNHEYENGVNGIDYFRYFGDAAGEFGAGYYSYTVGAWHAVALNSNLPMSAGTAQYQWLQQDLADNNAIRCTLVYFHHPRFTSGPSVGGQYVDAWRLMYGLGVDVVVNGHDHGYERFDPQDPDGLATPSGIREFIAGTGGAPLYAFGRTRNSAVVLNRYGVLKFTLRNTDYDWQFIEAGTEAILDSGVNAACH